MTDQTLRFRSATRIPYAWALIALVRHARDYPDPDFEFGPLDLDALTTSGLTISGPDLAAVSDVIRQVAGLVEVPA